LPPGSYAGKRAVKQYAVKIDGKEVRLDADSSDVEVIQVEPGLYLLRRGSEQSLVHVDGIGTKLTVEVRRPGLDPVLVTAEVSDGRRGPTVAPAIAGGAAPPVTIRSPIPGRVVKVMVKAGDRVSAGQTVVVVEAMKMENELRAPRAGEVQEVRCAEGAAVEAGQDLATLR
jgi:glutaconyl-CoA/methylmalonyl-CoA decarboxylase subunit gamma